MKTPDVFRSSKAANWSVWVAGPDGARVKRDLGTKDRAEAVRRAAAAVGGRTETPVYSERPAPTAYASPPAPPPARPGEDKMRALFARDAAAAAPPSSTGAAPSPSAPSTSRPASIDEGAASGGSTPAPSASGKISLSVDESKKLAELSATLAVQLNELAVGAAVRVFGRKPDTDDVDEEWETLNHKGWTSILERLVGQREASPLGVILVSSFGMGLGMYVNGTPIPKVSPPVEAPEGTPAQIEAPPAERPPGKYVPPSPDDEADDEADDGDGTLDLSRYRTQLAELQGA